MRCKGFTEADYTRLLDDAHQHVSEVIAGPVAAWDWLTIFWLAPYAHEFNLVKSVWHP